MTYPRSHTQQFSGSQNRPKSHVAKASTLSTLPHSFFCPSLVLRLSASPSHPVSDWVLCV